MIKRKFIVIIWHQAGGRNENQTFYTWDDEKTECAIVFDSEEEAETMWNNKLMNEVHAGLIVECTTSAQKWI